MITSDEDKAAKSESPSPEKALGGHIQSSVKSRGKAAFEVFFKQGNHMLGSAVFQVSPATEHAFCGLAGSQSSTSQSKLGSSLGKR